MITLQSREIKKIAVDFDGVLLEHLLGREWSPKKLTHRHKSPSALFLKVEGILTLFFMKFRKPLLYSVTVLSELKKAGVEIILVTARHSNVKDATTIWLKENGLQDVITNIYFNEANKQPVQHKVDTLKQEQPDLFIDDDYVICSAIIEALPSIQVIKMDSIINENVAHLPSQIIRVKNWYEVKSLLTSDSQN